jgi:hypothetical protein
MYLHIGMFRVYFLSRATPGTSASVSLKMGQQTKIFFFTIWSKPNAFLTEHRNEFETIGRQFNHNVDLNGRIRRKSITKSVSLGGFEQKSITKSVSLGGFEQKSITKSVTLGGFEHNWITKSVSPEDSKKVYHQISSLLRFYHRIDRSAQNTLNCSISKSIKVRKIH